MQQDGTHDMQGDTVRSKQKRHPYRSRVIAGVLTAAAVLGGTVATHDRSQAVPPPRSVANANGSAFCLKSPFCWWTSNL